MLDPGWFTRVFLSGFLISALILATAKLFGIGGLMVLSIVALIAAGVSLARAERRGLSRER